MSAKSTLVLITTLTLAPVAQAACFGDYGCDSYTGRYPADPRPQVEQTLRWNSDLQRKNDDAYQRSFEMDRQMKRDLDRRSDFYTPSWR